MRIYVNEEAVVSLQARELLDVHCYLLFFCITLEATVE